MADYECTKCGNEETKDNEYGNNSKCSECGGTMVNKE